MNAAHQYSISIVSELEEIEQQLEDEWQLDVLEEMNALDWEYTVGVDGALRSVRMIRTVGGPSCYVDFNGDGSATVWSYWGSDKSSVFVQLPSIETIV